MATATPTRRTERLPMPALEALARLDLKLAAGSAANYGATATARRNELLAIDPCDLSDSQFAEYGEASRMIAEAHAVVRAVTRFGVASERIAELSAVDAQHLSGADFNALGDAQDAVKASREFLTRAGLLHLIEGDV
ncbi:hypothetical protein OG785_45440 [Streptomyces sp. NBC_00006]|uniref:hypothetical protein n=1 Tax=Streptomyces sp. NBC_00006 TaxID=2975619 RepID=UPI002250311C|nr:hypothetical protein [Streptomyces sp. NBC_00006]MCX5528964.1 hypothetical protein [Streptomyces sp. NBC_00006]MCX5537804.1 hypothetical protein [Streptomyces sp. NBC_00006]